MGPRNNPTQGAERQQSAEPSMFQRVKKGISSIASEIAWQVKKTAVRAAVGASLIGGASVGVAGCADEGPVDDGVDRAIVFLTSGPLCPPGQQINPKMSARVYHPGFPIKFNAAFPAPPDLAPALWFANTDFTTGGEDGPDVVDIMVDCASVIVVVTGKGLDQGDELGLEPNMPVFAGWTTQNEAWNSPFDVSRPLPITADETTFLNSPGLDSAFAFGFRPNGDEAYSPAEFGENLDQLADAYNQANDNTDTDEHDHHHPHEHDAANDNGDEPKDSGNANDGTQ